MVVEVVKRKKRRTQAPQGAWTVAKPEAGVRTRRKGRLSIVSAQPEITSWQAMAFAFSIQETNWDHIRTRLREAIAAAEVSYSSLGDAVNRRNPEEGAARLNEVLNGSWRLWPDQVVRLAERLEVSPSQIFNRSWLQKKSRQ